jgi:tetratricopeptide (TPR) repeat protein
MRRALSEQINKVIDAIESDSLSFMVGAGISFEPPSFLTTWPQLECIKVLAPHDSDVYNEIVAGLRPEVFFQILYNILGERALTPMEILNPTTLNSEEELVAPNLMHFFLARMILKGHVVLTSNFDNLIERAFEKMTDGKKPEVAIYDMDFLNLCDRLDSRTGCLVKIHGSFLTPSGKDAKDSIVATLQQVEREFPSSKRTVLKKIVAKHDLLVMGYSGRDDFDVYPFLLEPPSNRRIWWIRHSVKSSEKWKIWFKPDLELQNKEIGQRLAPLRDYGLLNSNSIAMAYRDGVVIESHTVDFVRRLGDYYSPQIERNAEPKVRRKMQAILEQWAYSISGAERHQILACIFEQLGRDFLSRAQEHLDSAHEARVRLSSAQRLLRTGVIHYKKGTTEELRIARGNLMEALRAFEVSSSAADEAETYLQLLLVHNRLGIAEEGIEYGERAVNLYKRLAEQDRHYIYELARALRGLALISVRGIPDLSSITDTQERDRCERILKECIKLCETSLKLLQKIGNRSGERGEGQAYNVLGMIKLRLSRNYEEYREAKESFDKFLNLSGRSRFRRESAQGYRNVALCEFNLALLCEQEPEKKSSWLNKAIQNYANALICLGLNPEQPCLQTSSRDEFITRYNRSCAKIEQTGRENKESAVKELMILEEAAPDWHSRANVFSSLCRAHAKLDQDEEAHRWIEKMVRQYEGIEDRNVEMQPFGVQNARENLEFASVVLERSTQLNEIKELYQRTEKQKNRIDRLSQNVHSVPFKDWSESLSLIEWRFLKKAS